MNIDLLTLARIPEEDRSEVRRFAEAFGAINGPLKTALAGLAADLGSTVPTITRKYYAWKARGLAGLVNGSRHPEFRPSRDEGNVSEETYQHYRQLCLENGRKCRTAFKKLCREFFDGKQIPGLAPGTDRLALPPGWTCSNFSRHAPTKFETKAARLGLRAAAEFRPLVYTSRKEMYFFQELQFDDLWHDVESVLLDRQQRVRPQQLGSMEVLSACLFAWCLKPRIRREDDTRTNLGPHDMLFLLAAILGKHGHNPRGTRFNCEGGTAVPPDAAIDLLHKLSGGQITVRVGETRNDTAFLGQYPGQAKGNFRTRALIESFWNLTHNETADRLQFPGQTGASGHDTKPEDAVGRGKEMDLILRAMPALPEWVFQNLRKPLPEWNEAMRAIGEINERMNQRGIMPGTEHAIEGFVEAGLVTTDFDLPGLGLVSRADFEARLKDRTEAERQAIIALCQPRARKLSPREVFDSRRHELTPWRPEAIAQLLYPAHRDGVVRVTKNHLVVIEDKDVSPAPLRFLAHHFSPGDEFEVVINPMVPDLLFLYDPRPNRRGAWIGTLHLWGSVNRADPEAVAKRIGQAEHVKRELLGPVVAAGDRLARQRAEDLERNNDLLATRGEPHTAAERAAADFVAAEGPAAAEDILAAPEETIPAEERRGEAGSAASELLDAITGK